MNLNAIPLLGWFIDLILSMSLSVPFYIIWTGFGIGEKYFYFLPKIYLHPSFWNCVGVFIVAPIIRGIFTPKLFHITQNAEKK